MTELDDDIHEQIQALSAEGDEFAEEGEFEPALERYWAAWDLLPEPQIEWDAATWLLAAIGDADYQSGNFEAGRDNLSNAMHCPDAIGNPFLHLRLGQCQLELGDQERAADELARAYLVDPEVFDDEDPKYLAFLRTRLQGI
ncbi:tetratricopeptide repeat protein [Luteimonas sp. MJ204]|uniref:tetratricopeptide repeat protein n=1 Tax=Luteimonas sp. MJ145 TaxID=3129234 RepID=UPI0031BB6508